MAGASNAIGWNKKSSASSGETERVPSSEIARMLEERNLTGPPRAPAQPEVSLVSSGATNPFTSSDFARMRADGRLGATATAFNIDNQLQDPSAQQKHFQDVLHPSVRIVVEYSHSLSVKIAPVKHTDSEAEAASRQVCFSLGPITQSGPNSLRRLAVTQSKRDLGICIEAVAAAVKLLNCRLSFDPAADRVVLMNRNFESMTAKMSVNVEGGGGGGPQSIRSIKFEPYLSELLDTGSWAIFSASGQHVLNLFLLPRRNISIARSPDDPGALAPAPLQGPKRKYEQSQPTGASKKGRLENDDDGDGDGDGDSDSDDLGDKASIVFQPAPYAPEPEPVPPSHRQVAFSRSFVAQAEESAVERTRHPFEDLRAGDVAKIVGPDGEDYTLTYDKTISVSSNSHVFKAQHSGLPEKLAVVKVVRSPSGPVAPGSSRKVADEVDRTAEVWLREVRIHLQLSQHASVVRLYDHDARFLALYMENIDAPSLAEYCNPNEPNPRCTLSTTDAAQILSDTATALYYIHRQGFVHNDIKPSNILYSRARGAVLIDFGISTEVTYQGVHLGGTPWYIPPEFERGGKRGPPGDVFALGVVMLYVLGKLPLPERSVPRLHWKIADVLNPRSNALMTMKEWQKIVRQASSLLDSASGVEVLVQLMVEDPMHRISLDALVWECRHLGQNAGGNGKKPVAP
ncbi:hypothetical protein VTH06DRAFT_5606 [Thermothelomyces fergusii]